MISAVPPRLLLVTRSQEAKGRSWPMATVGTAVLRGSRPPREPGSMAMRAWQRSSRRDTRASAVEVLLEMPATTVR